MHGLHHYYHTGPPNLGFLSRTRHHVLKEHVEVREEVSAKGGHTIPRNYSTFFLTSQMLTETWVCSGCRVYSGSTVQQRPKETSRSKITNDYEGTKDEYCLETKTESGRNLEVTFLFICNAHNALGRSCLFVCLFVCFLWRCGPMLPHSCGSLITHNDASQSVGPLWTSDQLVAETST